jgi:hypothetical protein
MLYDIGYTTTDNPRNHKGYHEISQGIERTPNPLAQMRKYMPCGEKTEGHAAPVGFDVEKAY